MLNLNEQQYARLMIELDKHPHKEEVIRLMNEQAEDMMSTRYLNTDADKV
jgi:uncharacterized protein (DUF1778 family)